MARVKRAVNARRSAARPSSAHPATADSARVSTARPRSRSPTRWSTATVTAGRRRATSVASGSSASTPRRAQHDLTYNRFIQGLRLAGVEVDRKILADLAVSDPHAFAALVESPRRACRPTSTSRRPRTPQPDRLLPLRTSQMHVASPEHVLTPRTARVKAARRLATRRFREKERAFLAEGPQAVREALDAGRSQPALVHDVFATAAATERYPELAEVARGSAGTSSTTRSVAAISETVTPQGMVAVCDYLDVALDGSAGARTTARRRLRRRSRPRQRRHGHPLRRRRRCRRRGAAR